MFDTKNNHQLHAEAIGLITNSLQNSIDIGSVVSKDLKSGKGLPYHVEWNGLRFLVKVARPSIKLSQGRAKWFYSLRQTDRDQVDFFILFCLLENRVEAIYCIPKEFAPKVYFTITKLGQAMRYEYFRVTLENMPERIMEIKSSMKRLIKINSEAKVFGRQNG
jgi:hypothetical protein